MLDSGVALGARPITFLTFALTIPFALQANVVAKHGTQDEILFGCQFVERFVNHVANGIDASCSAKKQIKRMVTRRLNEIVDVLVFQSVHRKFLVFFVESVEHHLSYALLVLIDMVHEYLQLSWYGFSGFHVCRANEVMVSSSRLQTSLDVVNPCVDAFIGLVSSWVSW